MPYIPDEDIDRLIAEDVPYGDLTTRSLGLNGRAAEILMRAGADMVVCASEEAARIQSRLGAKPEIAVASGQRVAKGDLILSATGDAQAVMAGWKLAQTLIEYASGIATAAARIVAAARAVDPAIVVACTRKNFPGTKRLAVKAILAGDAVPHRLGLSDTLLLFPEHLAMLETGGLLESVARLKAACPEKKVVVEVAAPEDALLAARVGADVIQLERFSPEMVAELARRLASAPVLLAAAGGVNAANAADYARAGAKILVTSAPYAAQPLDVKVSIRPA